MSEEQPTVDKSEEKPKEELEEEKPKVEKKEPQEQIEKEESEKSTEKLDIKKDETKKTKEIEIKEGKDDENDIETKSSDEKKEKEKPKVEKKEPQEQTEKEKSEKSTEKLDIKKDETKKTEEIEIKEGKGDGNDKETKSSDKKKDEKKEKEEKPKNSNDIPVYTVHYKSFSLEECRLEVNNKEMVLTSVNQNTVVQKIPLREVVGIHRLSSKTDEERVTLQVSKKIGIIIGIVRLGEDIKKRFHKYFLFVDEKKMEKEITIVLQQLSFVGKFDYSKIKEFDLINNNDRKMLLIVNPKAGKKKAKNFVKNIIRPILDFSHLKYEVVITTKKGHAVEICRTLDFKKYNEIGCVGGDGTVLEVTNGLMNHKTVSFEETTKVPISVFPAGTGNVYHFEVGTELNNEIASLICARGKYAPWQISTVFHDNQRKFSTLLLCFGLFSDAAFAIPRFLGELAYTLGAVFAVVRFKNYDFKIKLIQDEMDDESKRETPFNPAKAPEKQFSNVWEKKVEIDDKKSLPKCPDTPLTRRYFSNELRRISQRLGGEVKNNAKNEKKQDLKIKFVEIEYNDVNVCCFTGARKVSSSYWGSPYVGINSGKWDLLIGRGNEEIKKAGVRKHFLKLMGKMEEKTPDNHIKDHFWSGHRCRAFYCEPIKGKRAKYLDIDGDRYKNSPAIVEVHKNGFRFMHL